MRQGGLRELMRRLRARVRSSRARLEQTALAQRRLAEAGRLVASSLDLRQVLDRFAGIALDLMHTDLVTIWLVDETEAALTLGAQAGPLRGGHDIPLRPSRSDGLAGWVVTNAQPIVVTDVQDEPRARNPAWLVAEGIRSFLGVPLLVDGVPVGVIAWKARARRAWSADDVEYGEALATTAAVAIRNARLHGETEARLCQTETLLLVGRTVNSTLDFAETMRRVARETGRALGADMVGAYIADADQELLRPVAGYRVPRDLLERFMSVPVRVRSNSVIGDSWRTQQAAYCLDFQSDPRSDPTLAAWAPMRTVIFFPLIVRDEPIGCLFLIWWTVRGAPTTMELSLLEGIARQTALAIGNARLFEARVRDAKALNEVSRSLAMLRDPREVFTTITKSAAELLDATLVNLWIFDAATGDLRVVADGGADADGRARSELMHILPGTGVVGAIFQSKQPEFIVDVGKDPRWLNRPLLEQRGLRGFAGVPLVLDDDVVGVLALMTRRPGRFTDEQRSLIETFASHAVLAVHNARVFEGMEHSLRETQALLGVADTFSHTQDLTEIMRRVCREATAALQADSAVFYTVNGAHTTSTAVAGYHIPKPLLGQVRPFDVAELPPPLVEAFDARETLFVPDVVADPRFAVPAFAALKVRSLLARPIYSSARVFGVVVVYWWDTVRDIADGDLALMAAIGTQAALVLENARLLAGTQSQAAALREKNAELDSFVYTVSHDLKAPLVTIQGMSSIVLDEYAEGLAPEARHYLERIQVNIAKMERLLLDLLALSRVGREGRPAELVHLAEVVNEALADLAEPLRERGIKVEVGDLPTVSAVRVQMEQVVRNLLSNAVKYMGDRPEPVIEIGSAGRDGEVQCWVRDTGIGIEPEYQDKIFEVFQRLQEVQAEGTGVGLPIVKKIVDAAGGRIWVESIHREGSTFHFTWPTAAPEDVRPAALMPEGRAADETDGDHREP